MVHALRCRYGQLDGFSRCLYEAVAQVLIFLLFSVSPKKY
jgi:hypothetical protein